VLTKTFLTLKTNILCIYFILVIQSMNPPI
jgi:hypothetical protein